MKLFVIDKKSFICMLSALAVALLIPLGTRLAIPVSVTERVLPIYCVEKTEKEISITFDSAWGNEDLEDILNTLDNYNCKATFFVVGDFIDKYPNSVKEIHKRGHEVANHSNNHAHYSKLSREEIIADMEACDEKIKNITGTENKIFRPPYGEYTNTSVLACKETGRYSIQWDVEPLATVGNSCTTGIST